MFMSDLPRGAAAILTLTLALGGCTRDEGDPTVSAAADLQRSLEMDGVLDLLGPGGGPALDGGKGLPAGLVCDESPVLVMDALCGDDFAAEAHYAWSDCLVDHPGERPDITTSGKLDLVRSVVGAAECGGSVGLEESATFEVSLALPQSRSAAMTGTIHAFSERDLEAGSFTRTTTLSATRSLLDDGELVRSSELAGDLEISVVLAEDGPVRTIDGTLHVTLHEEDGDATITLEGVVHRPLSDCAWPTAGTLVRARPDATHTLSFGPACGHATLDGDAVDLDDMQADGRGGRHGRGGHL